MSPYISHGIKDLRACHMTVNVSMHTTWCQMSPCMSHDSQCLHAYHIVVNVSIHDKWRSMSPCMSHGGQCLHACHMAVNVSMYFTWCQMPPYISHGVKYLRACHTTVNISMHCAHQQRLTGVKKTRRVGAHKRKSPPTGADQFEKDKTSGSAQALLQFTHTSYSLPITPTVYP